MILQAERPERLKPAVHRPRKRNEEELVRACQAGDREAAEELVRRTYAKVFTSVTRMCGDRELAADLTQDAYRRAWGALDSFECQSRFTTWLFRIAYNTFLNRCRRPALLAPLEDEIEVADPAVGAEEELTRAEERELLRRSVIALPDELRLVVAARYWGDISAHEIARTERVTRSAIRKRLARARRILRRQLGERR